MNNFLKLIVLGTALVSLNAQDRDHQSDRQSRTYEDKAHKDSHEWNDGEGQAYKRYLEEHHKKNHEFDKANKREQNDYWNWRHAHPDNDRHDNDRHDNDRH